MQRIYSWNVNGIRAVLKKGFADWFSEEQPDILCLQETKAKPEQVNLPLEFSGYHVFWNSAEKPGYSGTLILSKEEPILVTNGIGVEEHDTEGRVITAEYKDFYLVTVYTPNAQGELKRLSYRQKWDKDFLFYVRNLEKKKPVVFCGDLNVAHQEIDLARPAPNRKNPGFSDEERANFSRIVEQGFVDTYRHFNRDKKDAYSWWSYRAQARVKNIGWRLDYFCVSKVLIKNVKNASIHPTIMGSDHCPVSIDLDLNLNN